MGAIERSNRFKKDLKKAEKQTSPKPNIEELKNIMIMLAEDQPLSSEKRDHHLVGDWIGYRECHIQIFF